MNDSRDGNQMNEQVKQQTLLRIVDVLCVAAIIITSVYFFFAWQLQSWQVFVAALLLLAFSSTCLLGHYMVKNGRSTAALHLMIYGMLMVFPASTFLVSGLGIVSGVALVWVVYLLALQGLPVRSRGWFVVLALVSGILTALIDQWAGDYRQALPELQPFIGILAGIVFLIYAYFAVQNFTNYSLRTKMTAAMIFTVGATILILGLFIVNRTQTLTGLMKNRLLAVVEEEAAQILNTTVIQAAFTADQSMVSIASDVEALATGVQDMLAQEAVLGQGYYWDARQELNRLPSAGSWDNDNDDIASVYMPSDVELTDDLITEINAAKYLDFNAPHILQSHPSVTALYFIDTSAATIYYPNTDLASLIGDIDPRTGLWFTTAAPDNNPEGNLVWTEIYQDPAGTGSLLSVSVPIYDQAGQFRGVVAADVQLNRITEQFSQVRAGETGYAFLIDEHGHFIVMPEAGYRDLGLIPEELPINELPQQTLLGHGSPELRNIANRMVRNEKGLATVEINGTERYIAYAPVQSTNFSLGIIVPVSEMSIAFTTANNSINTEIQTALGWSIVFLGIILMIAFGISIFMGGLIANPVEQLRQAAQQIAVGNFDVKADIQTRDEIGVLADTFNNMTEQLQRSVGQLNRRNRAIETSTTVSRRLATILDPQQLVAEVVEQVQDAFNYYHAHIYLLDETGQTLIMAGGTGKAGSEMLASGHTIPMGKGLVGRAAATNDVVLVPDVAQDANWLPNPLLPDTKAEVAVPIAIGEQVLGVLDVQHNIVDGLRQLDAEMLQSVAGQVAIGLENARIYMQTRDQADQEALINAISEKIENAVTVESILDVAARELQQAFGARRTIVELSSAKTPVNGQ